MTNKEIAQKVVDQMLKTIDAGGPLPWVKPWSKTEASVMVLDGYTTVTIPVNCWSRSGKPYRGINPDLLLTFGKSGEMITFNQCKAEGGRIKKGAKGAPIVYWTQYRKVVGHDDDGKEIIETRPVLKSYTVFSVEEDTEGLEVKHHPEPITYTIPSYHAEEVEGLDEGAYIPAAEAVIAGYLSRSGGLRFECKGHSNDAYYNAALDKVVVPCIDQYTDSAEYYSTSFHELGHSTGHSSRLNREVGTAAFGTDKYSREELVAEITSASILRILGLESGNTFRNSTAYVAGWSKALRDDPLLFVTASSRAEKAVSLILGSDAQPEAEAE